MSRGLSSANAGQTEAVVAHPAAFFHGAFPSGDVRIWTGIGTLKWGGHDWIGAGALIKVSGIEETSGVEASGVAVTLTGVPVELVSLAIREARQNSLGTILLGFVNDDGGLVADPEPVFTGLLDVPQIEDGAETCAITLSYENQMIDLQRAREWRYTDESQKVLHPGDRAFEYVAGIQDKKITWGQ